MTSMLGLQPCRDLLLRGRCTYGERCKYLHPSPFELDQYLLLAQLQLGAQQVSSMVCCVCLLPVRQPCAYTRVMHYPA